MCNGELNLGDAAIVFRLGEQGKLKRRGIAALLPVLGLQWESFQVRLSRKVSLVRDHWREKRGAFPGGNSWLCLQELLDPIINPH